MSTGRRIATWTAGTLLICILGAVAYIGGVALHVIQRGNGESGGANGVVQAIQDWSQVIGDPYKGFPNQNKVNILCMGIDDNWTTKDEVFTNGARTDTLFLLSLDLKTHQASMLSIPRDTYAHIAGTKYSNKINSAYSTGGPQRSLATVYGLLGVHADHYMVLNIDATKKMVDALGGVNLNIEHEMNYDDDWGHLHIHLKPGYQHLNGDSAVGFARFRHARHGLTPEDGDERRMYRQHILLRAMIEQAKTFGNVTQAPHLVDIAMSTVRTDLSRTQLLDLAAIYHNVDQKDVRTASLPGEDFVGPHGADCYKLDMVKAKAYVAWLIDDDEVASRSLVTVIVKNGTDVPGLAARAAIQLKSLGYTHVTIGGNSIRHKTIQLTSTMNGSDRLVSTTITDTGVSVPNSGSAMAALLGTGGTVVHHAVLKPNRFGWTPSPTLTITLGQDYARLSRSDDVDSIDSNANNSSESN